MTNFYFYSISIFPIVFLMYFKRICNFCHKGQMDLQRLVCHVQCGQLLTVAVHRDTTTVTSDVDTVLVVMRSW